MIQAVISTLDAIAGNRLSAASRHGLCELVTVENGTAPAKFTGGDSWQVISVDTGGDWSYWRLTDRIGESRDDRFQACHIITASFPLRLVTLVSRSVCDPAPDVARAAASDMRQASATVRDATNSSLVEVEVRGVDTDTARVFASEFKGAGFGTVNPGKMLIAIDLVVRVTGTEACFDACGGALDLTCALIQKASNAKVEECLGEERLNEICDTDCETLCEQLADPAVDVITAVDCIPNGNIPEWVQVLIDQDEATPEVIVVGIEGAGKADDVRDILCTTCPYDGIIQFNGVQVGTFGPFDPCVDNTLNIVIG